MFDSTSTSECEAAIGQILRNAFGRRRNFTAARGATEVRISFWENGLWTAAVYCLKCQKCVIYSVVEWNLTRYSKGVSKWPLECYKVGRRCEFSDRLEYCTGVGRRCEFGSCAAEVKRLKMLMNDSADDNEHEVMKKFHNIEPLPIDIKIANSISSVKQYVKKSFL